MSMHRITCQGLSQSRGMGNAPTQAPTSVQATVICRQVSHTDIALEPETKKKQEQLLSSTQRHVKSQEERKRRKMISALPMATEDSYPGLDVGAKDTKTPQRG